MSSLIAIMMVFVLAVGLLGAPSAFAQASKDKPAKTEAKAAIPEATYKGIGGQIIAKQPAGKT
jgi:hypothetical protein